MKRWKLLIVLLALAATVAASIPPYIARDTHRDITAIVDSSATDSTWVYDTILIRIGGCDYLSWTYIFRRADADSLPGEGLDDSLQMYMELWRHGEWIAYDSGKGLVAGDTLQDDIRRADGDTSLHEWARFRTIFFDTVSDTTGTMEFELELHMFAK